MIDANMPHKRRISESLATEERLLTAVLTLWANTSSAEISVRAVASEADVAVSAIDYHFGKLEHLYGAAQARAFALADQWLQARLVLTSALEGQNLGAHGIACAISSIIDDWAEAQRPLAMARREASAMARDGRDAQSHILWTALWRDFWTRMSGILGVPQQSETVAAFCAGEVTQHLLRWKRPLDQALLGETVKAFVDQILGERIGASMVRQAYSELAEREYRGSIDIDEQAPAALDAAAADLLKERGLSALTFRAVADRAATTLGHASYHFGSKTRMLQRAFDQLYRTASEGGSELGEWGRDAVLEAVLRAVVGGSNPILRAFDEVIAHIARSEDHLPLRGIIRGYRDPAASWALAGLLSSPASPSPALAAAFSSLCRGIDHLALALEPQEAERLGRAVLEQFVSPDEVPRSRGDLR